MATAVVPRSDVDPTNLASVVTTSDAPQLDASFSESFRDFISCCLIKDPKMVSVFFFFLVHMPL